MRTTLPLIAFSPTAPPAAPPSVTCVPGHDGIPDSALGNLLCGTWATDAPHTAWMFANRHWPLLLACVLLLIATRIGVRTWRRTVWRNHAAQARWLEITPPVSATAASTVQL